MRSTRTDFLARRLRALLALVLGAGAAGAAAAEATIGVELNKLEPNGGTCRAYLVVENGAGAAFEALKLDVVLFDTEGVIARRLAVETAPLPAAKTSVEVFDVEGLACERIGRVLLNDVLECRTAGGPRSDCLDAIATSARGDVPFEK